MTEQAGFPLPSQLADVPGAENWRSMYQYFTRFSPDDDKRFWFYNSMHFPEPMPAFDTITAELPYSAIGANTARLFVFPTTLGIEHRIVNGRVYITANPVLDPAEIERRAAEFGPRAGYYFEHWDSLYEGWKNRLRGLIADIETIDVPDLPEWEDASVVFEARGIASNHYLRENFHRVLALYSKMWHHHTEMLMLGYGAYVVFFQFCQQAFPEISDQTVARMVAGIDVIMYRPDDELRALAKLAVELGLDDLFTQGCVAARRVSSKVKIHLLIANGPVASPDHPGDLVTVADTPAELRDVPCLTDDEIRALAAIARRVETHYGAPQDIEWAILDEDSRSAPATERIVRLQSRPETVWAAKERAPAGAPKPRAADHVLALFGKPL